MDDMLYYNLITTARQHATNEDYQKSFSQYLEVFENFSCLKKQTETEFRLVLLKLNEELAATNDRSAIFNNFETAIRHFPDNVYLFNDMGKYLYKYGYFLEALCHFEKALKVDSSFVNIEKNLNNAKRFLFSRDHFRNLNDRRKNEAYRRAIKQSITADVDNVLDLDTGTGLLALYATECRPISITACESSKAMAKLAQRIMSANNVDAVVVVNKPSNRLSQKDIYGMRTLLLTDMFDPGLLGQYILQNLSQAWEYLLTKEAKVLPARAEYFIMGVKSEKLRNKFQVSEYTKKLIGMSSRQVHMTTYCHDSYCGEDVSFYDDIEYVTEPASLFTVDFNNFDDLQDKLYRREPYHVELTATESGEVTTVIGWFNLHLTDDIMITNDPRSDEMIQAWQQAVFFDFTTKEVKVGDAIPLDFYTYHGRMTLLIDSYDILRVSPELLKFLNDKEHIHCLQRSVGMHCIHLGQTADIADVDMIDLCAIPILGIEMLKRGARSLVCYAKTVAHKYFLMKLFESQGISTSTYIVMMDEIWKHDVFKEQKFHFIFCNYLDGNGDIDVRKRTMAFRLCHAHLNEGGIFLPSNIILFGQLISSQTLENQNRISDENVSGFKMAVNVNRYQVSHTTNIDISLLDYTALSEPIVMSPCMTHMRSEVVKAPIVRDGQCSGILCWYNIYFTEHYPVTTKRCGSFIDCAAYLAMSPLLLFKGDTANVIRCVDPDGSFKLVVDVDV